MAAVFSANKPPVVGPVRSARETDLTLFAQFGNPMLASSGSAPELIPAIDGSSLQNASADRQPSAYFRDYSRATPHNLFVRPDQLPEGGGWPEATQLHFGPAPAGGRPTRHEETRYPAALIGFDWSPGDHGWLVSMDGAAYTDADTGRLTPSTVVMQSVPVQNSAISDVAGSVASPLAQTTGSGQALVLRDGQEFPAVWSRPSPEAGTTYTTPTGADIPFAPGQVWTVLVPAQLWVTGTARPPLLTEPTHEREGAYAPDEGHRPNLWVHAVAARLDRKVAATDPAVSRRPCAVAASI